MPNLPQCVSIVKRWIASTVSSIVTHTARLQTSVWNANGTTSINTALPNGLRAGCLTSIRIAKLIKPLESAKLSVHTIMWRRRLTQLPLCKLGKSVP